MPASRWSSPASAISGTESEDHLSTPREIFERLLDQASNDRDVLGLVPTGSLGKGWATETSDYDLTLVVPDEAREVSLERYARPRGAALDLRVMALGEFRAYAAWGTEHAWDRYSFAHVTALLDKTGGIQRLVDEKGRIPGQHRRAYVAEALDAYINSTYRSLKCLRKRDPLGARLEAADALQWLLTVIFAREGRHRPFSSYLKRELRDYPLADFPVAADEFLQQLSAVLDTADPRAQQRLRAVVEELCRADGHDAVFASWGDDWEWMKRVQPDIGC